MGPNVIYEGDTVCIRGGDGETAEGPQCVSHVDPINMGDTPYPLQGVTVITPASHQHHAASKSRRIVGLTHCDADTYRNSWQDGVKLGRVALLGALIHCSPATYVASWASVVLLVP